MRYKGAPSADRTGAPELSRIACLLAASTLALAACGPSQTEIDAQATQEASEAAAATQAAWDAAAARARENEQSLEAFYAGDEAAGEAAPPEDEPADDGPAPRAEAPAAAIDAPAPPPPPIRSYQPAPHPPPIPPVQ
jgi:hypothetical protein